MNHRSDDERIWTLSEKDEQQYSNKAACLPEYYQGNEGNGSYLNL